MDLLVLTQYFDTLHDIGQRSSTKCILLPKHENETRSGILQANAAVK